MLWCAARALKWSLMKEGYALHRVAEIGRSHAVFKGRGKSAIEKKQGMSSDGLR